MQVNLRIYCNSASKFKKEEITRYLGLGAVVVNSNLGRLRVFWEVEAEPLDRHYQAQPGN
ncbi:MAG: hypothetical protein EAZ60_20515 [Oscillatoriales cyanobacterium]|nr:MAG: hypothetical protein EAZ83_09930 [Oscillatoriales cyanobacterium]TAE95961.1 MAG: hypothetical protein EAZ79_16300 [Oscillatoriales cyanobacterium]TAF19589.1 MAG: hypothetical protein EAZ73_14965 [Oscillatoriales cyanobacterium]TAF38438.1 MAG: hypothetical protein EAZ69_04725 [Oscillatoriales cyanobacterium]TAF53377.1 MAG: hypothetical protein EAZ60_20515 [Oscillatoriales cyanobacterium]